MGGGVKEWNSSRISQRALLLWIQLILIFEAGVIFSKPHCCVFNSLRLACGPELQSRNSCWIHRSGVHGTVYKYLF